LSFTSRIKQLLTGLVVPQEYCCLELEALDAPLKVILTTNQKAIVRDVTVSHLFLGYKPLIIGLPETSADDTFLADHNKICLNFVQGDFKPDEKWENFPTDREAVAMVILKKIHKNDVDGQKIYLFEGHQAKHRLLGTLHQFANNLREKYRTRPKDNVGLPGNLLEQVRIAYSIPRKISVITVSDDTLVNMFPTDLHGIIGRSYYAGSLRIGGNANAQVESLRRVVIADVDASSYMEVYSMGRNHMMDLQNEGRFMLHEKRSRVFNFPLPERALRYREMIHVGSFDHGIHRVHFYQIVHSDELENSGPTLAHIHQYYAQWRMDQGLKTTLYLRKG
jgi:hypothetical protein